MGQIPSPDEPLPCLALGIQTQLSLPTILCILSFFLFVTKEWAPQILSPHLRPHPTHDFIFDLLAICDPHSSPDFPLLKRTKSFEGPITW